MPSDQYFEWQPVFFGSVHEGEEESASLHLLRVGGRQVLEIDHNVGSERFVAFDDFDTMSGVGIVGIMDVVGGAML